MTRPDMSTVAGLKLKPTVSYRITPDDEVEVGLIGRPVEAGVDATRATARQNAPFRHVDRRRRRSVTHAELGELGK